MRILIVEDYQDTRDMLTWRLRHEGHEVVVASDGREGLVRFAQSIGISPYDLLVIDCGLPVIDGLTLAVAIRKIEEVGTRRVPILFMSAHSGAVSSTSIPEAIGAIEVIDKLDIMDKLLEVIAKLPGTPEGSRIIAGGRTPGAHTGKTSAP